jgi:hypothetical protein
MMSDEEKVFTILAAVKWVCGVSRVLGASKNLNVIRLK